MSKLDDLINKLCLDGVEFKKLNEASIMQRGTSLTKANSVEGEFPVISGGKDPAFYCNKYNRDGETITVAGSGAGAGFVQYWTIPLFANDCFTLKATENNSTKYIYYFLNSIQNKIDETKKGGGVPHVHISDIENFEIPVPPLEIQNEIVRILDNFTALTAELTAELTARRKQYEYYRDSLLTFDDSVEWKTLGDICKLSAGGDVPKQAFSKIKNDIYNIPIYSNGIGENALYGYTNIVKINEPCVTIAARGTIGYTDVHFEPFVPVVRLICAIPSEKILVKFLYYFLQNIKFSVPKSGIPQLTVPNVQKIKIPVPTLDKQKQIVTILDRFESLCNDITSGLPAEIEARQKQYEYYRDKLLAFEKKKV